MEGHLVVDSIDTEKHKCMQVHISRKGTFLYNVPYSQFHRSSLHSIQTGLNSSFSTKITKERKGDTGGKTPVGGSSATMERYFQNQFHLLSIYYLWLKCSSVAELCTFCSIIYTSAA